MNTRFVIFITVTLGLNSLLRCNFSDVFSCFIPRYVIIDGSSIYVHGVIYLFPTNMSFEMFFISVVESFRSHLDVPSITIWMI